MAGRCETDNDRVSRAADASGNALPHRNGSTFKTRLFSALRISGYGGGGTSGGVSSSYAGEYDGQLTLTVEWSCYMAWPLKIYDVDKWCFLLNDKKWCDWYGGCWLNDKCNYWDIHLCME